MPQAVYRYPPPSTPLYLDLYIGDSPPKQQDSILYQSPTKRNKPQKRKPKKDIRGMVNSSLMT